MNLHSIIEAAAHEGAYGRNSLPLPTPAQAEAGNYKKGRVTVQGIPLVIENPRGSMREWRAADGTSGANLMKFHYGYFAGVIGADGDELDCYIGPYPESSRVFVINQQLGGEFDEHKVMLGFPDMATATAGYLSNFTAGWDGLASCIPCSIDQLKWWLANGTKTRPLTADQLPPEETQMNKVLWDSAHQPVDSDLATVLYKIRAHDGAALLVFDPVTKSDILQDADGVLRMDALVVPYRSLELRMGVLQKIMDRAGQALKVTAMQVTDPFTQRGTTNVAVIFELSDGQTISIFFHNPDTTPKKIGPGDELVSWKWMLNKKDITVVVAPERGRDLQPRNVAARIMALAVKNSARFAQLNANRAARMQNIEGLRKELAEKTALLEKLNDEIEVEQLKIEERQAAKSAPAAEQADPEPAPAPVATPAADPTQAAPPEEVPPAPVEPAPANAEPAETLPDPEPAAADNSAREKAAQFLRSVIDGTAPLGDKTLPDQLTALHGEFSGEADIMSLFGQAVSKVTQHALETARARARALLPQ